RIQSAGSTDAKWTTLRSLYPVVFYRSGAASIQLGRTASSEPWPLKFTDEGRRAQFLWLTDSPTESETIWNDFAGVYGYQALRDVKPGAQVYAQFADPQAATGSDLPVYMAGHFYGAGRVFYMGSGEIWRLNELDPSYFSTFYTKLIRHVSQGRLLRDSSRGLLLVDKERASLGDTLTIRAALSDEQYRPLTLDQVTASLLPPNGNRVSIPLKRLTGAERPGMYSGQFTATEAGDYRLELAIPGATMELLRREVKVKLPAREIESPQRNDVLLSQLAKQTGGAYSVGFAAATGASTGTSITNQLRAKDQTTYLPGTADPDFEQSLMTWLLVLISTALCLEWLVRRLYKLA
ncbi:MAG: hypothetical protein KDB23_06070, partial [Planctomycetales bacterium]|nr:hypothetical protein [Planctomycetales bacterium]